MAALMSFSMAPGQTALTLMLNPAASWAKVLARPITACLLATYADMAGKAATTRTWAPSFTKSLAVAAPIPLPPPVITATLPASLLTVFSLLVVVCRRRAGPRRAWTHHAQSVSTRRCPARHNFTDGRDGFSEA